MWMAGQMDHVKYKVNNQRLLLYLLYHISHPKEHEVKSLERLEWIICLAQYYGRKKNYAHGFNYCFLKRTQGAFSQEIMDDLQELVARGFINEKLKVVDVPFNKLFIRDDFVKKYSISQEGSEFIRMVDISPLEQEIIDVALGEKNKHLTIELSKLYWNVYHELELNLKKIGEVIMPCYYEINGEIQ